MSWRTKKRLIYILIFLSFLFLIAFLIYLKFKPEQGQCFNNKKDVNEEGVDCGGPCPPCELKNFQPLKKYPTKFLIYPDKTFDIIGIIENPNDNLGVKKLKYQFLIYDLDDNLKDKTNIEETILLPLEKKFLIKVNQKLPNYSIGKIDLNIFEPQPEDFIKISPKKLPVVFYNQKIFKENEKWKVSLTLYNQSIFPINIEVIVFAYNNNKLIGVTKGSYSLKKDETKSIILTLPPLILEPAGIEIYLQKIQIEP